MAELFKDRFNYESLYKLASQIQTVYDEFPVDVFKIHDGRNVG